MAKKAFLLRHKKLAENTFGDKSSPGVKPLVELARKELHYSPNTYGFDIARILQNAWLAMKRNE